MTAPGAPLGRAISAVVADAVHRVIVSVLPGMHAEKWRATMAGMEELHKKHAELLAPFAQEMLDTGKVHPLLVPFFEAMAGKE